jgi:antirestriction protein ArdC
VLFNNHTAVMPVILLLNFIVMAYQSPAAPIIHVPACYLYFSLPLFAAAHCHSSRHWRVEGSAS